MAINKTFSLDASTEEKLEGLARRTGRSMSELLRLMIAEASDHPERYTGPVALEADCSAAPCGDIS